MRIAASITRHAPIGALLVLSAAVSLDCYGTSGAAGTDGPSAASPPTLTPTRRLRRLSSREYDNVVRDLLGATTHPAQAFVTDAFANGYDNGSAALAVQSDQVASYQRAAEALAADVVARDVGRVLGGCDVAQRGADRCVEALLDTFAARAFRRPLFATEKQRLRDAFYAERASGGDFATGVRTLVEIVLQSPQFLYREELGPPGARASPGASVRLTDWEIASELSFLLTGSSPDDALWSAVAEGRFASESDRQREAARLLGTRGAKDALRAFMHAWLGTDRLVGLSKDPAAYPTFDATTAASMLGELDRTYDDALAAPDGSLRRLFTSSTSQVDDTLAGLYGLPLAGGDFRPAALDPALRQGIMTRAGFLAVHAETDSSGPIARGVFVLGAIMCAPPPPPPPNVPPAVPAGDPTAQSLTTRQRFERHVSSAFCAGCHTRIDGIGFGFEQFDALGAFRSTERGQPIDTSGDVAGTGEIDGVYVGVSQLSAKLAGSKLLTDCYRRQAYRFAMGQVEPPGTDPSTLAAGFSPDARLVDLFLAIVADPVFVTRTFEARR